MLYGSMVISYFIMEILYMFKFRKTDLLGERDYLVANKSIQKPQVNGVCRGSMNTSLLSGKTKPISLMCYFVID